MLKVWFIGIFLISTSFAYATTPYIPVGKAKTRKTVLGFPKPVFLGPGKDSTRATHQLSKTIINDLNFVDLFRFLPQSLYKDKTNGLTPDQFKYSDWVGIGADILLKTGLKIENGKLALYAYVYDPAKAKQVMSKRYVAKKNEVKLLARTFLNDFIRRLTGNPGIFLTQIAMACHRGQNKEIYVMDYDGGNVVQITNHRSIALAPAWHPKGEKLAYSVYTRRKGIKNLDLYEFDFKNRTRRLLSNRKGVNSGAAYSPNGKDVAVTMSFLGNPEIFILNLTTRKAKRLTKSFGFDVDPTWDPSGKHMAFSSSRSGQPMIYKVGVNGKGLKRLTFAGRYNATPNWSPTNNKIVFAGWKKDGKSRARFEIFTMNPNGTRIERLTKNQGNNEDPSFSPDGNLVAFSSDRAGSKNIYVMNIDGSFVKRLTYGLGNCVAPKWSPAT